VTYAELERLYESCDRALEATSQMHERDVVELRAEVERFKTLALEACELMLRPSCGHTWTYRLDRAAAIKREAMCGCRIR
jgi:hypothetical protein